MQPKYISMNQIKTIQNILLINANLILNSMLTPINYLCSAINWEASFPVFIINIQLTPY